MSAAPPPASPYQAQSQMNPADEKLWATLIHIGGILFSFVPALIGYIVLKDRGPFVRAHTATALNFQITMAIAGFIGGILTIVFVGFLILAAVWIINIIFSIMAAIAANKGEWYSYPLTIKFLN
jgi:uncharacterized Tic20 family protein